MTQINQQFGILVNVQEGISENEFKSKKFSDKWIIYENLLNENKSLKLQL